MKFKFKKKKIMKQVWIVLTILMVFSLMFFSIAPAFIK